MKITLWGTRGSLASPGPDTVRYGGNTSCASIEGREGTHLVLDAGTGIRVCGRALPSNVKCVHILLTHLHMDHVQGLPFFDPLRRAGVEVHIWGPASTAQTLETRLYRYLSPPLFPVRARDLRSELFFHEIKSDSLNIGEFLVKAQFVLHPNPTLGYRIQGSSGTITYMPDHEPALGLSSFPTSKEWTSGYDLAEGADLLIHDAQYSSQEYAKRIGFGHSSIVHAIQFADLANVKQFVPFHHDPAHSDAMLDRMISRAVVERSPSFKVTPGKEGAIFEI